MNASKEFTHSHYLSRSINGAWLLISYGSVIATGLKRDCIESAIKYRIALPHEYYCGKAQGFLKFDPDTDALIHLRRTYLKDKKIGINAFQDLSKEIPLKELEKEFWDTYDRMQQMKIGSKEFKTERKWWVFINNCCCIQDQYRKPIQ